MHFYTESRQEDQTTNKALLSKGGIIVYMHYWRYGKRWTDGKRQLGMALSRIPLCFGLAGWQAERAERRDTAVFAWSIGSLTSESIIIRRTFRT